MNFKLNRKGGEEGAISILLSLLMLSMLLSIGLGVSVLMFQQIKMTIQSGQSVVAFYAADAGAEECFYQVNQETTIGCDDGLTATISCSLDNGATCSAEYDGEGSIISTGRYGNADRALELNW